MALVSIKENGVSTSKVINTKGETLVNDFFIQSYSTDKKYVFGNKQIDENNQEYFRVNIKTREEDPNNEHGEIEAPILIIDKISADLERIIKDHNKVVLNVHPFVAAYLTKGFPSLRSKWFFEHKKWVKIIPRDAYTYLEFHFLDNEGTEIIVK